MSNVSREESVLREKQRKRNEEFLNSLWKLETKVNDGILEGTHDAEGLKKLLQAFLEEKGINISLAQAINILGHSNVITAKQTANAWGIEAPKKAPIRHNEATLRQCAQENQQSNADWRIVYCFGDSLRDLWKRFGTDPKQQPCFCKDSAWLLKSEEDSWATKKMESGYYLINFFGQFSNMTRNQQEAGIIILGNKYERCHEAIFSEAIFTIFMVNNGERIAKDWYHRGVSTDSVGGCVGVGYFNADGFIVFDGRDGYCDHDLRVSVARKFDY